MPVPRMHGGQDRALRLYLAYRIIIDRIPFNASAQADAPFGRGFPASPKKDDAPQGAASSAPPKNLKIRRFDKRLGIPVTTNPAPPPLHEVLLPKRRIKKAASSRNAIFREPAPPVTGPQFS
jgi:hypothetical protein